MCFPQKKDPAVIKQLQSEGKDGETAREDEDEK
jgi:hypothetical protein